ncbi:MAG TPA: TadE/TadG family type IV pilus assembly protein [Alphaproteobacteria bacterium]|nr:TadE/TadG family type IV pilus assembly protein [Alphaproteobacteria bacterium]
MAMRGLLRKLRRCPRKLGEGGTAIVELALVAPVLTLLMCGTWDFGNALFQAERLQSAAKAGAQYGIQSPTTATDYAGMISAARNDASDTSNSLTVTAAQVCQCPGGTAVSCSGTCAGNAAPNIYVQVKVSESYSTLFSYPFIGNPLSLSSQVMMRSQ